MVEIDSVPVPTAAHDLVPSKPETVPAALNDIGTATEYTVTNAAPDIHLVDSGPILVETLNPGPLSNDTIATNTNPSSITQATEASYVDENYSHVPQDLDSTSDPPNYLSPNQGTRFFFDQETCPSGTQYSASFILEPSIQADSVIDFDRLSEMETGYDDIKVDQKIMEVRSNTPDDFKHINQGHDYHLRPREDRNIMSTTTGADNDNSGDYVDTGTSRAPPRFYPSAKFVTEDDVGTENQDEARRGGGLHSFGISRPPGSCKRYIEDDVSSEAESPKNKRKSKTRKWSIPRRSIGVRSALIRDDISPEAESTKNKHESKTKSRTKSGRPSKDHQSDNLSQRPKDTLTSIAGRSATTIITKLCYPIQFNFQDQTGQRGCSFCESAQYPMLGLGTRKVRVYDFGHGKGLEEFPDAKQPRLETTKICMLCTISRMRQLICRCHDIQPMSDKDASKMDFGEAFQRLFDNNPRDTDMWCSLCPSPAFYHCSGSRVENANLTTGCGLLLCEGCAVALHVDHEGDLGAFLKDTPAEASNQRPMGLRADAELLKPGGPLEAFLLRMRIEDS